MLNSHEEALACAKDAQDLLQGAKRDIYKFQKCLKRFHEFADDPMAGRIILAAEVSGHKAATSLATLHFEVADLLLTLDSAIAGETTRRR